jgi:hypothetical protein
MVASKQDKPQNLTGPPPKATQGPPPVKMLQMMNAYRLSQSISISVAAKLGIADILVDGPKTSEELGQVTKLMHSRFTGCCERLLASVYLLKMKPVGSD